VHSIAFVWRAAHLLCLLLLLAGPLNGEDRRRVKREGGDGAGAANSTQAPTSSGQPQSGEKAHDEIDRILNVYKANANNLSFLADDTQYQRYLVYSKVERPLMYEAEQQRIDKQTASASGGGATTSAVSKPSVPWLFGFAVEHGALTQSVENNIISFRGNVANILKALNTKDYVESFRRYQDNAVVNQISRASFSLSFTANQSSSANGHSPSTLAGYSFHVDLYNHRDPRDKRYLSDWNDVVKRGLTDLASKVGDLHDLIDTKHNADLQNWQTRTNMSVATLTSLSTDDDVRAVIKKVADDYVATFGQYEDVRAALERVATAMMEYTSQKGKVVAKIESSPVISVEYTNTRQSVSALQQSTTSTLAASSPLPDLSNINFIMGLPLVARSQLTFNASTTLFNSLLPGSRSGSVRDYRFSAQADMPLPNLPQIGKSTLTFSGLFLSLLEEPLGQQVLINGISESRRGNIGLFQATFSVPVKGAGVKIPISLTASNRTELIKEKDVRGTIGITLDLDSLFAKSGSIQ
jgi:hypothetical protein